MLVDEKRCAEGHEGRRCTLRLGHLGPHLDALDLRWGDGGVVPGREWNAAMGLSASLKPLPTYWNAAIQPATLLEDVPSLQESCRWWLGELRRWWTTNWRIDVVQSPIGLDVTLGVSGDVYGIAHGCKLRVLSAMAHGDVLENIQELWRQKAAIPPWPPTPVRLRDYPAVSESVMTRFQLDGPGHSLTWVSVYAQEANGLIYVLPADSPHLPSQTEE